MNLFSELSDVFRPVFRDGIGLCQRIETSARDSSLRGVRRAAAGLLAERLVRRVRARRGARHDPRGEPGPAAGSAGDSRQRPRTAFERGEFTAGIVR